MSSLDEDLKEAQRLGYGVWYGRYKADHPGVPRAVPVEVEEPEPEDDGYRPNANCLNCGKAFRKYNTQHRYCSGDCREKAGNRRTLANYHVRKEPIAPRVCPNCEKEFLPWHRGVRFCCRQCQRAAEYKRNKNKQEEIT